MDTPSTIPNPTDAVASLLQETKDWINIQEIIKLTFKSVFDLIKSQNENIKEIENALNLKASKTELSAGLALKSNVSESMQAMSEVLATRASKEDIGKAIASLSTAIDTKIEKEKATWKTEISETNKASTDKVLGKVKQIKEQCNLANIEAKLAALNNEMSTLKSELEHKANKQTITNSLNSKVSKAEIEALIEQNNTKYKNKSENRESNYISLMENKLKAQEESMQSYKEASQLKWKEIDLLISSIDGSVRNDINSVRKSFQSAIQSKIDTAVVEQLLHKMQEEYMAQIDNSISTSEKKSVSFATDLYNKMCGTFQAQIDELATHSSVIDDIVKRYEEDKKVKNSIILLCEKHNKNINELEKCIVGMQKDFNAQISLKADINTMQEQRQKLMSYIEAKINHDDALALIKDESKHRTADIEQTKANYAVAIKQLEDQVSNKISNKLSIQDINSITSALTQKVGQPTLEYALSNKVDKSDYESIRAAVESITQLLSNKASSNDLYTEIISHVEDINKELLLKANIKDVCTLIDMKANIDDVNNVMSDLSKKVDTNSKEEIKRKLNELTVINEALCSENCIGRWIWKSGDVKSGNLIPWEVQSVNTCPENYLWESAKTVIITVAPGLYEIMMGFYNTSLPEVCLFVNGEQVLFSKYTIKQFPCNLFTEEERAAR